MFIELLLTSALLATQQTGKLELANVRATQGGWGATRTELKLPLGEAVHFTFDVVGLQPDDVRRIRFRTTMSVSDAKGKPIYQPGPVETVLVDLFGTGQTRQSVQLMTGLDQPAETYRLKVTVQDLHSKKEASFTKDIVLLPAQFGLIRVQLTSDRDGQAPTAGLGVVGQTLYVNAAAVGYQRDPKKEDKGAVSVEMFITDDKDKPITPKPLIGDAKDIPADVAYVPLRFEVPLQKAGQFKIVLKATDQVSKKEATVSLPVQILEQK